MSARRRTTALLVVPAALLCACSSGTTATPATPAPEPTVASAPPAPRPPRAGACHVLSVTQATAPVDPSAPVPCGSRHTSVTVRVARLDLLSDGHLLAVDSRTARGRAAAACPQTLLRTVGGDQRAQRLSRFEVVWFTPTPQQADAGADWVRCDLLALGTARSLAVLPRHVAGVLGSPAGLDRFGTCGTAAPDARGFQRVACAERHSWRAVDVVDLPASARYLDKAVTATGDAACKSVASARANGALRFTWSFEWPTKAQWASGQRYGYCWLPST